MKYDLYCDAKPINRLHCSYRQIGEVNRIESDDKFAGGKGINVSRILQRLGIDNTATGFIGGFTGRFVTDSLDAEGIKTT